MSSYMNSSYYQSNNAPPPPMATAYPLPPPVSPNASSWSQDKTTNYETSSVVESSWIAHLLEQGHAPQLTESQIQQLTNQGFTRGLAESLNSMLEVFALRIWIIDNSGSMQKPDGHKIVPVPGSQERLVKMVPCSRWEEIVECVEYHIQMAGLIGAPSKFRFLNHPGANVGPQEFSVATTSNTFDPGARRQEVMNATNILRKARPAGCTPLTSHILAIHAELSGVATILRQWGKKVVLVIATDGLPTDERGYGGQMHNQEFVEALRLLEGLPVWVVVRLCTDEDDVVQFYNQLDEQLELSLEVLDDFTGEALEVTSANPWINYALPLHRLREMGYHDRVMDMMDERTLSKSDLRDFCGLLLGATSLDGLPDPSLDWSGFVNQIDRLLQQEDLQFDPVTRRLQPWICKSKLKRTYGQGCACM